MFTAGKQSHKLLPSRQLSDKCRGVMGLFVRRRLTLFIFGFMAYSCHSQSDNIFYIMHMHIQVYYDFHNGFVFKVTFFKK